MKKGLTILIAIMAVLSLVCFIGSVAADDKDVGSSFKVIGAGVMDVRLEINTDDSYSGLSLSQYLYTPSLGMAGPSYLEYRSEFELGIYDIGAENQTQDLTYIEEGLTSNVRHSMYIKNYAIGSSAGFKYTGNATQEVEAYADNALSTITIGGQIEGKMKLHQQVVDHNTYKVIAREVTELRGNYVYEWDAYSKYIDYSLGKGVGDWLGCP